MKRSQEQFVARRLGKKKVEMERERSPFLEHANTVNLRASLKAE